jgi:putative restriction endonuclease
MSIVNTMAQLEENFAVLHSAVSKGDENAIDLVRMGKAVVVGTFANELAFGPSRFLGYVGNDVEQHLSMRSKRDGKETNPAIDKVLGFSKSQHSNAETAFVNYCRGLGIEPPNNKRNFWILPEAEDLIQVGVISEDQKISHTEKVALIKARIGQGQFRSKLEKKWNSVCCITGCNVRAALRASHIKPWKVCTNLERLDSNNGLLLSANADALFDSGLISFDEYGKLLHSEEILDSDLNLLLGTNKIKLSLSEQQQVYMQYHREAFGYRYNDDLTPL